MMMPILYNITKWEKIRKKGKILGRLYYFFFILFELMMICLAMFPFSLIL